MIVPHTIECRECQKSEISTEFEKFYEMKRNEEKRIDHIINQMSNRFEILGCEEGQEDCRIGEEVVRGKNHAKHQRRAAKRAAERAAQQAAEAKRLEDRRYASAFRSSTRRFDSQIDQSIPNRFVWHADSADLQTSIRLTPDMFPPLK
jgi:hypothetical protein